MIEKAALLPREIRWHFIGGLQSSMFFLSFYFLNLLVCVFLKKEVRERVVSEGVQITCMETVG